MKHKLLKMSAVIFMAFVLPVVLALTVPRSTATRWYTTPPLAAKGTRVKFLIPAGWEVAQRFTCGTGPHPAYPSEFSFARSQPREYTLFWNRPFTLSPKLPQGELSLLIVPCTEPFWNVNKPPEFFSIHSSRLVFHHLFLKQDALAISVDYRDDDQTRFLKNYNAIIDSITVVH